MGQEVIAMLNLIIGKPLFNPIKNGKQSEYYVKITNYWTKIFLRPKKEMNGVAFNRMLLQLNNPTMNFRGEDELLDYFDVKFKDFKSIHFRKGFRKDAQCFDIKIKGLKIDQGREDWGAEFGVYYFVVRLGKLL